MRHSCRSAESAFAAAPYIARLVLFYLRQSIWLARITGHAAHIGRSGVRDHHRAQVGGEGMSLPAVGVTTRAKPRADRGSGKCAKGTKDGCARRATDDGTHCRTLLLRFPPLS
jgi:hypothetical protein